MFCSASDFNPLIVSALRALIRRVERTLHNARVHLVEVITAVVANSLVSHAPAFFIFFQDNASLNRCRHSKPLLKFIYPVAETYSKNQLNTPP